VKETVLKNGNTDLPVSFFSRIRTKMLFSFSLLFFFSLIAIELVRIYGIPFTDFKGEYQRERTKVFQGLNLVADLKKDRFLRWLKEVEDDSEVFAENKISVTNSVKLVHLVRTESGDGGSRVWKRIRASDESRTLTEYISLIKNIYHIYSPLQIIDMEDGTIIASTEPEDIGEVLDYFPRIKEQLASRPYGILISRHHDMKKYDFNLFRKIIDGDSTPAALIMHIDIDDILQPMLRTGDGIGETGEALLVDGGTRIIASLKYPLPDGTIPEPMEYEIKAMPAVLASHGNEGIIETRDYRGVPVLAAYRHLHLTPHMGWGLVVKRDAGEVYASFRGRILHSAVVSFVGMLVVSALVLVITRKMTGPIMTLSDAARSIDRGRLEVRAPVLTNDEVGSLAQTFNMMVQRLEEWYTELENQVASRTSQLQHLNRELEKEIGERKHIEVLREQLIQELESKNAELERFTYTVSHDLKSPLITIYGFMGVMERDMRAGDVGNCIRDMRYIKDAAEKMQKLLDDLLELSRVGSLARPSETVSVSELAKEAVSLLSGPIEKKHVEVKIPHDLPVVFVDRVRLVEVFQNLIENAVKFMDNQRKPCVEVWAVRNNGEVLCSVKDNGIGIDPRYHEKIFSLFDKLDPRAEGTGVGLALVRRIIEVHGGRIWAESEGANRGTVFYFTLPQKQENNEREVQP